MKPADRLILRASGKSSDNPGDRLAGARWEPLERADRSPVVDGTLPGGALMVAPHLSTLVDNFFSK